MDNVPVCMGEHKRRQQDKKDFSLFFFFLLLSSNTVARTLCLVVVRYICVIGIGFIFVWTLLRKVPSVVPFSIV